MSIAVLTQVYDEVRRISIAGSTVAAGDFRLKKLVPPLEQAGAKAPVFAKVAQAITKLVDSDEKSSADALLEVSTLVNAILYTQGETGAAGELAPIPPSELTGKQTQASARVLKPLLEALTTTGSGRLEIIRDAHEQGAFADLRLVSPAVNAIDDVYPEIGEFIADKVLPLYGTAVLPELRDKFDHKGKAGHLRRLSLMHRLDPEGSRATVKLALDEGSKEMKVVAIECLGGSTEDLAFLLEQAKAKAKDVRAAAFKALGKSDADAAVKTLCAALLSADLEAAVRPVNESKSPAVQKFVLEQIEKQFETVVAGKEKDKAKAGKQVERLLSLLECIRCREEAAAAKLLQKLFAEREKLAAVKCEPSGKDIENRLVDLLSVGPKEAHQALFDAHATLSEDQLAAAFVAACRSRQPAEVFELFAPYLRVATDGKKKRGPAVLKREAIVNLFRQNLRWRWLPGEDDFLNDLDPRWLDLAVESKDMGMVHGLAKPGHAAANKLLSEQFAELSKKSKDAYDMSETLRTMVRVNHPEAGDAVMAAIAKYAKVTHGYGLYWIIQLIPRLPKETLPKLEALLPSLPDKVIDQLMDAVTQLKTRE